MEKEELQRTLFEQMRRMGRFGMDIWQREGELTRTGAICLIVLEEHESGHPERTGMYVWELAARMLLSPPAVSRMLRDLEARGQIERTVDLSDRRSVLVSLSPAGRQICRQQKQEMQSRMDWLTQELGLEQTETLVRLLGQLNDLLEQQWKKERI